MGKHRIGREVVMRVEKTARELVHIRTEGQGDIGGNVDWEKGL